MIDYHNRKIQELTERLYSAQVEFEKSNINEKNLNEKLIASEENHLNMIKSIRNEYNLTKSRLEGELKCLKDEIKLKSEDIQSLKDLLKTKEYEYKDAVKSLESGGNTHNKEFENLLKANQELKEIIENAFIQKNIIRSVSQNKNQSVFLDNKFNLANDYFSNPELVLIF